jgi:hypothetical protein
MSIANLDKLNRYGRWLPTPFIEKITVYDEKITAQVSIKVGGDYDYNAPTELIEYMVDNLNFYVMCGLSQKYHERFLNNDINVLTMMSSSAELRENSTIDFFGANVMSTLGGHHGNFWYADFSDSEPVEDWYDTTTLHYKLTTEVDIDLSWYNYGVEDFYGAEESVGVHIWSFSENDPFEDPFHIFTMMSDDYSNLFLYAFSTTVDKDTAEYVDSPEDRYNRIYFDQTISEITVSDASYEHVFKDGILNDEPQEQFVGGSKTTESTYNDVPIQGINGRYYTQEAVTHDEIHIALEVFYEQYQDSIDTGRISEELLEIINSIKYIQSVYGRKPELLVQLNQLRRTWPIKTPGTSMGRFYRGYRNMIHKFNNSLIDEHLLHKRLIYNNKILDRRSNASMDAATWSEVNSSFFGSANVPTAEERAFYTGDGAEYPYTGFYVDTEYEHYVIYNNYFMHRVGVNLNPIEVDDVSDVIESGFEDILNKGYYFIDYERIVNDYLLMSRVYHVKGVEAVFGKEFTNSLIKEKTLSLTRYNSKIELEEVQLDGAPIFDKPIKEFWIAFDEDYSYPKVKYMTHQNLAYTDYESPSGHAVLETDYRFSIDSESDGYYIEELSEDDNMVYSYVIPRNFDVLNTSTFYNAYDNYRLLCMSFEDYYSWEWATDVGREKEGGYFQIDEEISTEYYHTVFHIEDHSLAAVVKLIESFLKIVDDFVEYGEYAKEACSYNAIDDKFNSFFAQAMVERYTPGSEPWILAPLIFNIHREMLYFTFQGSRVDLVLNTNSLMTMVHPETGTLDSVVFLLEGIQAIAELYAGVDSLDEAAVYVHARDTVHRDLKPFAAFINEWGTDPIDMQFEGVLECFPPIVYTADIVTTLGGEPTVEEDPPAEEGSGGGWRRGGFGGTDKLGDDELFDIVEIMDKFERDYGREDPELETDDEGGDPSELPGGF